MIASKWPRSFLGTYLTRRYQHGYIILVPEIGEDSETKDPCTKSDGLPEFNNVTIENCRAAIAKQSLEFEQRVKNIEKELSSNKEADIFDTVFKTLEEIGGPLDLTWGLSKTLYLGNSTLMPTSSYISIHERARQARASKYNNISIYNAVKAALDKKTDRSSEEARILQKFAVEGRLNGLELGDDKKPILNMHLQKITKEKTLFKQKTEISTKIFSHVISDPLLIEYFPETLLQVTALDPNVPKKGPWKLTLQPYIYGPAIENCPDRNVRWNLWQAMVGRGSNLGDSELTTSIHIAEIRSLRKNVADLLGFETFADMSMETKMANSVSEVKTTINTLLEEAKPSQDKEVKELHEFAVKRGFQDDALELWDLNFWKKQQQKYLFVYGEKDFKPYFPLNSVLKGLFQFCEKLFNITIKERTNVTVWHKDVKFYDLFESHSSAPVAGFYFDPYVRQQQKLKLDNSGWMVAIQNKSQITNRIPLSALIFNFDPPSENKDCCLNFKEVKSLFQKFGNNLQHLLTRVNYSEVAGLSNVEWDAVEVSGHVLGHWLHNKTLIDSITSHCETGESLPIDMFNALMHLERHMSGTELCQELYLASLDMELHSTNTFWMDVVKSLWPQYKSFKYHKIDVHPCSFSPIFSEEWGAAYYSHIWSRMIAADIYSAFYEVRDDEDKTKETGIRYRNSFLALGGSVHPSQIFREFRGRDPSPKALLRSLGLKKN